MDEAQIELLRSILDRELGEVMVGCKCEHGELSATVKASRYFEAAQIVRDHPELAFAQLMDLSGLDYAHYGNAAEAVSPRFAIAVHLLSVKHNCRLRIKVFAEDDAFPVLSSVVSLWPSANWFERETFELYGIIFEGHPDLRRLLTDYGFSGYPLRKDFPVSGYLEMRYDEQSERIVYQPVSIEPRENMPRIVREPQYGDSSAHG